MWPWDDHVAIRPIASKSSLLSLLSLLSHPSLSLLCWALCLFSVLPCCWSCYAALLVLLCCPAGPAMLSCYAVLVSLLVVSDLICLCYAPYCDLPAVLSFSVMQTALLLCMLSFLDAPCLCCLVLLRLVQFVCHDLYYTVCLDLCNLQIYMSWLVHFVFCVYYMCTNYTFVSCICICILYICCTVWTVWAIVLHM
jgi:hypothetical protein